MNNSFYSILFLLFIITSNAQGTTDTVEVSRKYKTILIFPENIVESIVGSEIGYVANIPNENKNKFHSRILKLYYDDLLLEDIDYTNHKVITESGDVYDFILTLKDRPKKLTWYLKREMAVTNIDGLDKMHDQAKDLQTVQNTTEGNNNLVEDTTLGKSEENNSIDRATEEMYRLDPMEYYRLRCYYMQFDKAKIRRYFSRLDNIFLWLKGVYYNENELYIQFRIENNEGLDLDINFIKYHMATTYKNSSSNQRLELKPIFVYKQPKAVTGKSENHFVVVFKKFALDEKKEVVVELDEESGNRNLSLKIGHEIINNPIHF